MATAELLGGSRDGETVTVAEPPIARLQAPVFRKDEQTGLWVQHGVETWALSTTRIDEHGTTYVYLIVREDLR